MEKIKYSGTEEVVYYEKLTNGLDVYMYPSDTVKNFYITFNVKYGSIDTEFKLEGDKTLNTIPNGTAHFIEHQMFQEGNGETAFEKFAELGSSVNAFTTYGFTCYEVIASNCFKQNLNLLLDYVQNPVFINSSINNEKGIISEEIKMYDNNPNAALTYGLEYNLNNCDKHKYLISGTIEDIKQINSDILYKTYDTFYQPSNMFIIISGNFKPLEALGIIKNNQNSKEFLPNKNIIRKTHKEPLKVSTSYEKKTMNVSTPKLKVGYKINKKCFSNYDDLLVKIYLDALMTLKFGSSSDLLETLNNQNLITWDVYTTREIRDDYVLISLTCETDYPDQVIELFRNNLTDIQVTKEEIERIKRVNISNFILHFNDIISVTEDIQDDIINDNKINDNILDIYKSLNVKDANQIASCINVDSESIFIID